MLRKGVSMRKILAFLLQALFLTGLLADNALANGASGLFVENLEWKGRLLLGHDVYLVSSYSENGYCDFDGIKLKEGALFIPFKTEIVIPWANLLSAGKADKGLCADARAKIVFKTPANNNYERILVLNPVSAGPVKIGKVRRISFEAAIRHFDLFTKKGITPRSSIEHEGQLIEFEVAYDLDADGVADLIAFSHAIDYTHTYLLGKKKNGWVILSVVYPL